MKHISRLLIIFALGIIGIQIGFAQAVAEGVYNPTLCWDSEVLSDECLTMMETFPKPELENILEDRYTLNAFSFWRVGPGAVNLYDAPGGNVIGQIPAGFNFINAIDTSVDGWIQRVGGEWLSRDNTTYVPASYYTGLLLPEDWQYPIAYILDRTGIYASLRPGEKGSAESGYVTRRYDLVNIFAEERDSDGILWYLIGPNQWIRQNFVAKFDRVERPEGVEGNWVAVDLFEQTLIAYEDDTPVFATLISSGLPGSETNEGVFEIWARLELDPMGGATGKPDAYALQDVPWVMYFDNGNALHGTYWHDDFGYRRSRGCVNMSISDARWVYDWTAQDEPDENGNIASYVYVYSSQGYEGE
jgi:L,D-transpeptidase catalytic domain